MRMIPFLKSVVLDPYPLRTIALRLGRKFNLGSYLYRLENGVVARPHYGYCVYQGALLAKKLGHRRVSVIEFGVAGGRGLLDLEYHPGEVWGGLGRGRELY